MLFTFTLSRKVRRSALVFEVRTEKLSRETFLVGLLLGVVMEVVWRRNTALWIPWSRV